MNLIWLDSEMGGTLLHRATRLGKCNEIDRLIRGIKSGEKYRFNMYYVSQARGQ